MTDLHENSKLDTALLLDAAAADLYVDNSQYLTDLADNTTYLDESPSARTAIAAPREVTVIFNMLSGQTGTLVDHSNGVTVGYRVEVTAGNALRCIEAGVIRVAATIPSLDAVSDRKILVQWSEFPDGSNTRSELAIYNFTAGSWTHAQATHAVTTPNTSHTLTIGARYGGSNAWPDLDILQVRIGVRFHSGAEALEDWVTTTSAPTVEAAQRCEGTPIDRSTEIGTHGAFAGPAALATGRSTKQANRRLLSPVANVVVGSPSTLTSSYGPDEWHRLAWGASTARLLLSTLLRRPVPPVVREVYVRVHVRQYTVGAGVVPVYLRAYSLAGFPTIFSDTQQVLAFHTTETSINTNHTSTGDGEWVTLGRLPVARDNSGMSYFCIAYDFNHDVADANLANTRLQIRAIVIDPFPSDASEGASGLDIQEG